MQGLHGDISHYTTHGRVHSQASVRAARKFTAPLTGVKTLGGQVIDLLVLIRHLRDKLRCVNILSQATY
jgi:hypothetical protein